MEYGTSLRDIKFFHTLEDITHADAPSLMMHRWMMMFFTVTNTWKEAHDGRQGSPLLRSKFIRFVSEGLTAPSAFKSAFC